MRFYCVGFSRLAAGQQVRPTAFHAVAPAKHCHKWSNDVVVQDGVEESAFHRDPIRPIADASRKKSRPDKNDNPQFNNWINWGAGPRASQYLVIAAKSKAIMDGRYTPDIDDIKSSLVPVLRHRIIPNFNAEAEGITSLDIISKLIEE